MAASSTTTAGVVDLRERLSRLRRLEAQCRDQHHALVQAEARRLSAMRRATDVVGVSPFGGDAAAEAAGSDDEASADDGKGQSSSSLGSSVDNLRSLLEHLKDPYHGVPLADRMYHLRKYHACFVGSELVTWLVDTRWARDRAEAVALGNSLLAAGAIRHVKDEHDLKDDEFFYRFQEVVFGTAEWVFPRNTRLYSVAISDRLARQVENASDAAERRRRMRELRHYVGFLFHTHALERAERQETGTSPSPEQWMFLSSHNNTETFVCERSHGFHDEGGLLRVYKSKVIKCTGALAVSSRRFVQDFLSFRSRPRYDPLFAQARVVAPVPGCANARILYRTTISPIRSMWPKDVCVLQDHFTFTCRVTGGIVRCVYEISVDHRAAPPVAGHARTEVLASVRFVEDSGENGCVVTHFSQVDIKKDVPRWFLERWLGLPSAENYGHMPAYHRDFRGVMYDREVGVAESRQHAELGVMDFEPLAVLGRGAHSKIMQVRHIESKQLYAMKVIQKTDIIKTRQVANVMRERNILSTLTHPNLVRLHFSFQTADKLYLVMDYCAGGDMFTYLERNGKFPLRVAKAYAAEIVSALRYLHSNGVAHRDLKPENLFFGEDGHLMVGDLGLSKDKLKGPDDRTYTLVGTPEYMAPELLQGLPHSMAVDWWQFGVVLHEMLSGTHPFYCRNMRKMHEQVVNGEPKIHPDIPKSGQELVRALLRKNPDERLGKVPGDVEAMAFFQDASTSDGDVLKPRVLFPGDVSNFDDGFTRELPVFAGKDARAGKPEQQFRGFAYDGDGGGGELASE